MEFSMNQDLKNLKIGNTDKKKDIYISYENRFLNTLVIGNKGTGKTSLFYRNFAYQTIKDKNVGGTFVVSSKDIAYQLHLLAKTKKRRVAFINPTISYDVEQLLNKNTIKKSDIKQIFNFERFIFNNYIVIIDLEPLVYGEKSIIITSLILECIKEAMSKVDSTCMRPHFLYIEDSCKYIKAIEDILYYGNQYNISTTLFFQNREQFKSNNVDYSNLIDSNICNIILTNSLNLNDSKYYSDIFDTNLTVSNRGKGKFFYRIKSKDGAYLVGSGEIKENTEIEELMIGLHESKKVLKRKKKADMKKKLECEQNGTCDLNEKDYITTEDSNETESIKGDTSSVQDRNLLEKNNNDYTIDIDEFDNNPVDEFDSSTENKSNNETGLLKENRVDLNIYDWLDDEY